MIFIGDVHGNFSQYLALVKNITHCFTIQVGDFGLGFGNEPEKVEGNHYFIRGNHDNPAMCEKHPNYLGDYGYMIGPDIFYLSGANSVDKHSRVEGRDVWHDEELPYRVLNNEVLPMYAKFKPKIVVTHDAPISIITEMFPTRNFTNSRTNQVTQAMFEIWQPDLWVFGHHHINKQYRKNGTLFVCVGALDTFEYEKE